jgi:hypothetical protein
LANSEYRFYAINGGNDLGGMFLMPAQAQAAQKALPNKRDWPYLPEDVPPWYGQYHRGGSGGKPVSEKDWEGLED